MLADHPEFHNSFVDKCSAIVAKLPVDLTTNMPSDADQLSKLTGTTMICICIGFMAPSVASSTVSEGKANVASLGIFIVTVVVNICIQMRTGVLSSSPQLLNSFRDIGRNLYPIKDYDVTFLTMVVLVKVVAASVPDPSIPIVKSMRDTLDEAFEIVHYVDQKMNVKIKDS
ncbi:hypothetical protein Syun_030294 [Stephania yunnanensis]|uniref:Uncharacterized protein n=1 Tax=Stephania yunnanensis TaxID=152371 RepID=A0AAP0HM62_9MAGN